VKQIFNYYQIAQKSRYALRALLELALLGSREPVGVKKLADAVKNLNPLLVYVKQEDIEKSFRKAVNERPEDWFNGFVHYYTAQGYGLKNNLIGLDGTIEVLKARQELEFEILEHLNLPKVIVDNSRFELDQHRERLTKILENEC